MKHLRLFEQNDYDAKADQIAKDIHSVFLKLPIFTVKWEFEEDEHSFRASGYYYFDVSFDTVIWEGTIEPIKKMCEWLGEKWTLDLDIKDNVAVAVYTIIRTPDELDDMIESLNQLKEIKKFNL